MKLLRTLTIVIFVSEDSFSEVMSQVSNVHARGMYTKIFDVLFMEVQDNRVLGGFVSFLLTAKCTDNVNER
jgi:hypothetical protein